MRTGPTAAAAEEPGLDQVLQPDQGPGQITCGQFLGEFGGQQAGVEDLQ